MHRVCMCDYNKHTWWPWFYSLPRHSSITTFYLPKYALEQTDECVCYAHFISKHAHCIPCLFIYLVISSSSLFFDDFPKTVSSYHVSLLWPIFFLSLLFSLLLAFDALESRVDYLTAIDESSGRTWRSRSNLLMHHLKPFSSFFI